MDNRIVLSFKRIGVGTLLCSILAMSAYAVTLTEESGKDKPLPLAAWNNDGALLQHCNTLRFGDEPCPSETFSYDKIEGDWWVRVQQGSGNGSVVETVYKHFIHDLTPPICKLTNQAGGTVDVNTLPGLNGKWAKEGVVVYPHCTDLITIDGVPRINPTFCKALNVPQKTLFHGQDIGTSIQVQDLADNIGYCSLPSTPKVDTIVPILRGIEIEHAGLNIPKEGLSPRKEIPNRYRASDGDVFVRLTIGDSTQSEGGTSGVSGLSFKSDTESDASDTFTRVLLTQIEDENGTLAPTQQKQFEVSKKQDLGSGIFSFNLNESSIGGKYPILSQAGLYSVRAIVEDRAGNSVRSSIRYIRIYAGQANEQESSFLKKTNLFDGALLGGTDCTEEIKTDQALYANTEDACSIEYALRDAFGNELQKRPVSSIEVSGQDQKGSYSLLQGPKQAFTNGLRLTKDTSIVLDQDGNGTFTTTALLPSVVVAQSPTLSRAYNMKVAPQTVVFDFEVEAVGVRGQRLGNTSTIGIGTEVVFLPWLKATLDNTVEKVLLQEEQKYNVLLSTTNVDPLPNSCVVNVYGYPAPGTIFTNDDFSENSPKKFVFSNPTGHSVSGVLTTHLAASLDGGKIEPAGLVLASDVTCSLKGKEVVYPGGIIGDVFDDCSACDDGPVLEPFAIQADIEGGVLGLVSYTDLEKSEENIREVGINEQQDIREDITKNAFTMVRSLTPKNGVSSADVTLPNGINFSTESVWYYKGVDVIIPSSTITGVGTIVVEDGNIVVAGNMEYADVESSLGIIVINNEQKPYSTTGNVYVKRDVSRFVGTYFADGGVLSYITLPGDIRTYVPADQYVIELEDIPVLVNSTNNDLQTLSDNPLARQLLLEGALLTRNTLGGDNFSPRYTPWETTDDLDLSRSYDLHFIRRYTPNRKVEYRDKNGQVTKVENLILDNSNDRYCMKKAGVCDINKNAFVVRADRKVNTLPPPGFKVSGTIAQ